MFVRPYMPSQERGIAGGKVGAMLHPDSWTPPMQPADGSQWHALTISQSFVTEKCASQCTCPVKSEHHMGGERVREFVLPWRMVSHVSGGADGGASGAVAMKTETVVATQN